METKTNALATRKDVQTFLSSPDFKSQIAAVLPQHLTADRMARVAMTAIMGKTELIEAWAAPAGRASIINALMRCSQMGIEPDGRNAHLVAYWSSKMSCYIIQLIVDYKGLVSLAKRNGIDARAELVYSNDEFDYVADDGSGRTVLQHKFNPFSNRGELIGVYSRAVSGSKQPDYEVMSIAEVESIRARSKAKDGGPWVTDYAEMVKKTPLRRHSKRWELDPEARFALENDDDTPDFHDKPQVVPPAFSAPKVVAKLKDAAPEPEPEIGEVSYPEEPTPPPTAKKKVAKTKEKPEEPTLVKVLQDKLAAASVGEGAMIAHMHELGSLPEDVTSLQSAAIGYQEILQIMNNQFDSLVAEIRNT